MGIRIVPSTAQDATRLADIRVAAMRPSLEAVGRFDPVRARLRFIDSFDPDQTNLLFSGEELAGFYVLRSRPEELSLDHLYICDAHQGKGIGSHVVALCQAEAHKAGLPIRLMALRDSPANHFYQSCGFMLVTADEFDNHYEWRPDRGSALSSP